MSDPKTYTVTAGDPNVYADGVPAGFTAPPIKGYQDVSGAKAATVNQNKEIEERLLRRLEMLGEVGDCDPRWLALAKTHIEQGFMALNRAVFQPQRVKLPEDNT